MTNTIMIVDDEPMVATAVRSFLEFETPYRVLTFTDPNAALDALPAEEPDVIIADFLMPAMDGISFLRRCREIRPVAARVLLTGYADKQNAIRAVNEAGLYHFLEKPWDNEQLSIIVRNGVERSMLFTQLDARVTALEAANVELNGFRQRLIQAFL